ncbi:uncharacterized protein F4807DRAFT_429980 [Annulohypoxylon truncatum]|uniref:uncharacterized protein n=1 Tax=Annulohypoxylon truncatum TaxID=327061 RepID=UPI0020081F81|nr:uncharacterized protein F4807DRAFT_429980 [Annulohypoxylon truncatum]KAI1208536.1 hypothetical protein F4807DRAFT_429980 [Annulohypoxylon truncatum]
MQLSLLSVVAVVAFAMNVAAGPVPEELLPRTCSGVGTCGKLICKVKSGCTCVNEGCLEESSRICTCA